jgi:hypothetical protein
LKFQESGAPSQKYRPVASPQHVFFLHGRRILDQIFTTLGQSKTSRYFSQGISHPESIGRWHPEELRAIAPIDAVLGVSASAAGQCRSRC